VAEYVGVLRDLGEIAADHGVRLAFEFLGFGWSTVRTPRGAWEIVRATDRPNVGLSFDAAHFYGGGGGLDEITLLDPAQIFTFHLDDLEDMPKEAITDANRLLPGRGSLPLDSICRCLSVIGYDGPCSVELFRPEYWQWQPLELAMAAREDAVRVLEPYFRLS
jgi:2-keto-myo-inositol isomerase